LLLFLPTNDLIVSFAGTFAVVIGFAMLTPISTEGLMEATAKIAGRLWGTFGRMAPRNVVNGLSRTGIAIAALTVAVSVTIGVSVMVTSFRQTVISWLDQTLQGDIYISPPSVASTRVQAIIDSQIPEVLLTSSGIQRIDVLRTALVNTPQGPVHVAATNNPNLAEERIFLSSIDLQQLYPKLAEGSVLCPSRLPNRTGLLREEESPNL
jgi:putative ABC transport system permease protein